MGQKIDFEILYWFNRIKFALSGTFYKNAIRAVKLGGIIVRASDGQSVRRVNVSGDWSKRPMWLVKASDVIGQCVRCGWSIKCPRSLVNASGTNDVVIRLSDLINYMNWCQVEVKNICFNTADGQWLIGPARPASPMFVAHRPWQTSTADALTFSSDALTLSADALTFASDALTRTL